MAKLLNGSPAGISKVEEAVADEPEESMVFPPHGFIRLVEWMGDERAIVNAARVSLAKESTELDDSDRGLLRFLLKNRHGSPFEHGYMARFHARIPIFVMREWQRHRIGFSINEESGRYVEMRPDFYIHDAEHVRTQKGKPGHYTFETVDRGLAEWWRGEQIMSSNRAFDLYRQALEHGIAKEVARTVLPLNLYTEFRWTCNARSMMNFLSLRYDKHAMLEIRKYAGALEEMFAARMPTIYEEFNTVPRTIDWRLAP